MPAVNQDELARALNLSRTTVSRSLSNHPAISAATRRRVQAMARKLGYRRAPTRAVRRPRDAKPITYGVLIGTPLVPADGLTLPRILDGIRRRARIDHAALDEVSLDVAHLSSESCRRTVFRHIRAGSWRGALLLYPFPSDLVQTLARKLSLVSLLTEHAEVRLDLIDTDHGGIRQLVHHLADLGHRQLAFIHWHYPAGGLWGPRRFAAFAEAMTQRGLDLLPSRLINLHPAGPAPLSPEAVADLAAHLIRQDGVTAFVCAADHQAYRLLADLRTRGLEAPRDYSLTGFDGNTPPPDAPPLTTLAVANEDVGASAVARLTSRLLAPTSPLRHTLVETTFIPGRTVGPPPA